MTEFNLISILPFFKPRLISVVLHNTEMQYSASPFEFQFLAGI